MQQYRDKQAFLAAVCSQIRFRDVRRQVSDELSGHMEDQTQEYIARGMEAQEAAEKAVEQMGDPVEVGRALDKAHRPHTEWSILALASALLAVGIGLQYILIGINPQVFGSFSYVIAYELAGVAVLALAYCFGSRILMRYDGVLYALLVLGLLAGILALNWRFRLNAYYAALLFIPVYACLLPRLGRFRRWGIVLAGALYAPMALLCLTAPNFVAVVFLSLCCLVLLTDAIASGVFSVNRKKALPILYAAVLLVVGGGILLILLYGPGYQAARIARFITPGDDVNGADYAFTQIRLAIASAQPFGYAGPPLPGQPIPVINSGASLFTGSTDFSLTFIVYRFGTVFAAALLTLFAALIVRMFLAVRRIRQGPQRLLALSATLALTVQIVFYCLSNLGVIAPIGAVLPFVSFGALGLVTNMALLGVLLSVYRRKDVVESRALPSSSHSRDSSLENPIL